MMLRYKYKKFQRLSQAARSTYAFDISHVVHLIIDYPLLSTKKKEENIIARYYKVLSSK